MSSTFVTPHFTSIKCFEMFWNVLSESVMGNSSLQPNMENESSELQLDENFLQQLKDKHCNKLKVRTSWRPKHHNNKLVPVFISSFSLSHWPACLCLLLQEDIKLSLGRIIELEYKECWKDREKPRRDDEFPDSEIHIDICQVRLWNEVPVCLLKHIQLVPKVLRRKTLSLTREVINLHYLL